MGPPERPLRRERLGALFEMYGLLPAVQVDVRALAGVAREQCTKAGVTCRSISLTTPGS